MRLTYKFRLYPTKAQAAFLDGQIEEACDLYNAALQERRDAWATCRKRVNYYDQANQLKGMRADGCLKIANYGVCQDVLRRVDRALVNFFRRIARKQKAGYPRYRSVLRYDSITFPSYGDGCRLLDNGKLRVQGVGHIRAKVHRAIDGEVKTATIRRSDNKWYVCLSVSREASIPLRVDSPAVGIDLGISKFATLSSGETIENPRFNRAAYPALRRAARKLSRRHKGSKRRDKARRHMRNAYQKVARQRSHFHHTASRRLVDKYGLIAVERLVMQRLTNGLMAKHVLDAGWAGFLAMLDYKAEWAGSRIVKVDPRGTSQSCICGARVPKKLSTRWHLCPECGLSCDRDHASARIILQRVRDWPSGANVGEVVPCVA